MKKLLLILTVIPLLFTACDGGGDAYEPVTILPDLIGGYQLDGFIENIDSGDFTKYSGYSGKLTVTSPSVAHVKVDGYIQVTGTNNYYDPLYIAVATTENNLEELFPVELGNFNKNIYFRRKGVNKLVFCYLSNVLPDGKKQYTFIASINVTNKNDKIKYLVPSTYIQAFDNTIVNLAKFLKATVTDTEDIESIARVYHDYIVKELYYDFDSLDQENRKAQDALSVLDNGMAVCEGYSTLYTALLRAVGIKAQVYTGQNHAWSKVYWSGKWHDIDVTWDDPVLGGTSNYPNGENLSYAYFDTGFTGEDGHIGTVNDLYKK